jgi:hypothetical protein
MGEKVAEFYEVTIDAVYGEAKPRDQRSVGRDRAWRYLRSSDPDDLGCGLERGVEKQLRFICSRSTTVSLCRWRVLHVLKIIRLKRAR